MSKKTFCYSLFLIIVYLLISACAKPTNVKQSNNSDAVTSKIEEPSAEEIKHRNQKIAQAKREQEQAQNEPPLFTHMIPTLDPIMWTNESEDNLAISSGRPVIVGRLPGQRELPIGLFEEAAANYNLSHQGSVVIVKTNKETNLWQRVRNGFALAHQTNRRIENNIKWYARHQEYLNRVSQRAEKYIYQIVEETEKMGMPLEIALLPVVESAFQPFAYSHGRAAGLWQFIPGTGKIFGLKQNWWYDGRRDVTASTKAALTYLKQLQRTFKGDWLLALAAYNSGAGTVRRAIKKNKRKNKPTDFWSLDLPRETRGYVPKLLAIAEIVSDPKKHKINLPVIDNKPYMAEVKTGSQIDLALAADLAEISLEQLYILNPAYNRWATDPKGPHRLMVPVDKAEIFKQNLAALPQDKRLSWKRHTIKKGQSLLSIADKYSTTVALIKDLNQIRGNLIRAGQSLIIPVSSRNGKTYSLSAEQRLLALQNTKKKGKEKVSYTVKSGDTFWSISRKFGVGYRSLAKWNGLAPRDTLRTGQKLVVWTKNGAIHRASFSPHASKLTTQKINYRVRRGDSLARISRKFKVNISDLKRWNSSLSRQKYLQPGQKLKVYVDVTNQAGST